jgi:hypothetical protein
MQELTVIGVENGALLVASELGERYRIAIDDVLQSRIRQSIAPQNNSKRISPREIQGHIRAGLSADEVARLTGASAEYVERFEGPVLAERAYVVNSALKVAVQSDTLTDPLNEEPTSTFGEAITERLESLNASDDRWASWKEESGWVVKLSFTANQIDHDARWSYDPKRHALAPLNNEAVTLSQHGELTEGLIPRLRAVGTRTDDSIEPRPQPVVDSSPVAEPLAFGRGHTESSPAATAAAIKRSDVAQDDNLNQTADLLEALRRRRGEREAASYPDVATSVDDAVSQLTEADSISGVRGSTGNHHQPAESTGKAPSLWAAVAKDTPLDGIDAGQGAQGSQPDSGAASKPQKRSRAAMPSWDEIVFGARTDDDLA